MTGKTDCSRAERTQRSRLLRAEMKWQLRGDRWSSNGPVRGVGARVGSYRAVLVASHEHGMLKRKARLTANTEQRRLQNSEPPPHLHRWEDDGGSVRGHEALGLSAQMGDSVVVRLGASAASK